MRDCVCVCVWRGGGESGGCVCVWGGGLGGGVACVRARECARLRNKGEEKREKEKKKLDYFFSFSFYFFRESEREIQSEHHEKILQMINSAIEN